MVLFGKQGKGEPDARSRAAVRPIMGRTAYCRVCDTDQRFSRCWLRVAPVTKCLCCGLLFKDPAALYEKTTPACPQCGEFLEHAGFEYGYCDNCDSKYELVAGAKPSLLPGPKQREAMNKVGKVWSPK